MIEIPLNQLHKAIYCGLMFIYIQDNYAEIEYYHEIGCSYGQFVSDNPLDLKNQIDDNIQFLLKRYPNVKLIMRFYSTEINIT